MSNSAQIHRFHEDVAIYLNTGKTIYLSVDEAKQISQAIDDCVVDINNCKYRDSKLKTFSMGGD